jgi:hypothetical protein
MEEMAHNCTLAMREKESVAWAKERVQQLKRGMNFWQASQILVYSYHVVAGVAICR